MMENLKQEIAFDLNNQLATNPGKKFNFRLFVLRLNRSYLQQYSISTKEPAWHC